MRLPTASFLLWMGAASAAETENDLSERTLYSIGKKGGGFVPPHPTRPTTTVLSTAISGGKKSRSSSSSSSSSWGSWWSGGSSNSWWTSPMTNGKGSGPSPTAPVAKGGGGSGSWASTGKKGSSSWGSWSSSWSGGGSWSAPTAASKGRSWADTGGSGKGGVWTGSWASSGKKGTTTTSSTSGSWGGSSWSGGSWNGKGSATSPTSTKGGGSAPVRQWGGTSWAQTGKKGSSGGGKKGTGVVTGGSVSKGGVAAKGSVATKGVVTKGTVAAKGGTATKGGSFVGGRFGGKKGTSGGKKGGRGGGGSIAIVRKPKPSATAPMVAPTAPVVTPVPVVVPATPRPATAAPVTAAPATPAPATPAPVTAASFCPDFAGGNDLTAYNMCLDFATSVPTQDYATIARAAATWESIITANLPAESSAGLTIEDSCNGMYPTMIDDLYICIRYRDFDGVGGTLAEATPLFDRVVNPMLPFTGIVEVDQADAAVLRANGMLEELILHEIGHVLGIGTRWEDRGVVGTAAMGCPYMGAAANAQWEIISGCGGQAVPVETSDMCGHWQEVCLPMELMSPDDTDGEVLSSLTIATLQDLGYTVTFAPAMPFTPNPACVCGGGRRALGEESTGSDHAAALATSPQISNARKTAIEQGRQRLQERRKTHMEQRRLMATSEERIPSYSSTSVTYRETDGQIRSVVVRN